MEKEYSVQQLQYMGSYHRAKVQHDSTQQLESTQEMNHFFTGVGLFFQGKSIDQTKVVLPPPLPALNTDPLSCRYSEYF